MTSDNRRKAVNHENSRKSSIGMKILIFHRDGIFLLRVPAPWIGIRKKILLLSHLKYPSFFGGVFEQNVGVCWARKPSQDGMKDGFFLLAIARRSSME